MWLPAHPAPVRATLCLPHVDASYPKVFLGGSKNRSTAAPKPYKTQPNHLPQRRPLQIHHPQLALALLHKPSACWRTA